MSLKEADRLGLIKKVLEKRISAKAAGQETGLSERQIKRLVRNYRSEGAAGLVSKRRGLASNNRIKDSVREAILSLVSAHYYDFGPTLACEKLLELHNMAVSRETLRKWMIEGELWRPKAAKKQRNYLLRERRPCYGELIQIDGSPHDWFEGRAPICTLIVFIDDATSQLMHLRLVPGETTQAYMEGLGVYLARYGRPVSLYSDRHGIFKVNIASQDEAALTQFSRALKTLDIEGIHARSPQAKGRVERANQTLQDRLVKELRLQKIDSLEAANRFLDDIYIADHNRRFAVVAKTEDNAHRPVLHNAEEITQILSIHAKRIADKNLILQYKNTRYQITSTSQKYTLRKASITVCDHFDKPVTLLYQGQVLTYKIHHQDQRPASVEDAKTIHTRVEKALMKQANTQLYKPAPDHPWRQPYKTQLKQQQLAACG